MHGKTACPFEYHHIYTLSSGYISQIKCPPHKEAAAKAAVDAAADEQ